MNRLATVGVVIACVFVAGCGDKSAATAPSTAPTSDASPTAPGTAADNTAVNKRDSGASAPTPINQKENSADIATTAGIRKAVVGDDALSQTAKNVKIITADGKVTLRGPVKSEQEKAAIKAAAVKIAGASNVDDQLEVAR